MQKLNKFNNGFVKFPRMMEMLKQCNSNFKCIRFIAQPDIQTRLSHSCDPFSSKFQISTGRFRPTYSCFKLRIWDRKHK